MSVDLMINTISRRALPIVIDVYSDSLALATMTCMFTDVNQLVKQIELSEEHKN